MSPDLFNGLFELCGGLFILNHCRKLYADKQVKGVSLLSTVFFAAWGFWNLFYYPHLDQWVSFAGGLLIVAANTLWILMMVHYLRVERDVREDRRRSARIRATSPAVTGQFI